MNDQAEEVKGCQRNLHVECKCDVASNGGFGTICDVTPHVVVSRHTNSGIAAYLHLFAKFFRILGVQDVGFEPHGNSVWPAAV